LTCTHKHADLMARRASEGRPEGDWQVHVKSVVVVNDEKSTRDRQLAAFPFISHNVRSSVRSWFKFTVHQWSQKPYS
jgi:hypothetical protein